ncbi:hypothetical protein L208DRAFT_1379435 [Tricholoma matsutake]|nr:hypothetical protein L208DRAFT_1379435 [Tricholoma matsutake 945]
MSSVGPTSRSGAKVEVLQLAYNAEQREATEMLYKTYKETCYTFSKGDSLCQQQAQVILKALGLDRGTHEHLESRWNRQWSNSWPVISSMREDDERRRILFQW